MIRTAILGYGRNGSTMHAGPLERYNDFDVVAVCDIDPSARAHAHERFGCPVYDDYHEMLARIKPEFTVIVTRSHQHAQMAIDCMKAGSNVLVTKPWATNAFDAQRMMAVSEATGRKLLPWLPARCGSDLRAIKDILARGDIGRVFEIRRSECTFGLRSDWQTLSRCGGGYLLNWGPHLVDQPLQLTGAPVTRVYGNLRQIINPGDVEDNVRVICHTEDGVTVVSEFLIAAGDYPNWVVQGDRGTIYVHGDQMTIYQVRLPDMIDSGGYRSDVVQSHYTTQITGNRFGDEYEIYPIIARVLRGEAAYFATPENALMLSRILDAARMSSRSGQEVLL